MKDPLAHLRQRLFAALSSFPIIVASASAAAEPPPLPSPTPPPGDEAARETRAITELKLSLSELDPGVTEWRASVDEAWSLSATPRPEEGASDCPRELKPSVHVFDGQVRYKLALRLDEGATKTARETEADACVYRVERITDVPRDFLGRALRDGEGVRFASIVRDPSRWSEPVSPESIPEIEALSPRARAALAMRWLDDARSEHASVASFNRATLELMALGAPPPLLAAAQQAALDEIRHARRCFSIASCYAAMSLSPGALEAPEPRPLTLATLATETLIDGCIGETIAVMLATTQRRRCVIERVREALSEIIVDESRHAELAWSTVAWALREGGEPVREALRARVAGLAPVDAPGDDEETILTPAELAAHGRLTASERGEIARRTWAEVIQPLLEDLLS